MYCMADDFAEITFKPGEKLVGDVQLSGNGIGTRLGMIKFSTSTGQSYQCGADTHTKYLFPAQVHSVRVKLYTHPSAILASARVIDR